MARVAARPRATADIVRYLRHHAGSAFSDKYRGDFRTAFRRLADYPESGSPRPALGHEIRIVTVRPYVVLHRFDRARDTVFVLRVLHGRRRLALDVP